MIFRRKLGKLGTVVSCFLVSSLLMATSVFASPAQYSYVYLTTPYGTMTGMLKADTDNGVWIASTSVEIVAPVIYVIGDCRDYDTGALISSNSATDYNTTYVSTNNTTNCNSRIAVFGTHEVRGQYSYVKYNVVTQLL